MGGECAFKGDVHSFSHLFTMTDNTTMWAESVPLKEMSTFNCLDKFISCGISRFGLPDLLTSDKGAQFISALWSKVCSKMDIQYNLLQFTGLSSTGLWRGFTFD